MRRPTELRLRRTFADVLTTVMATAALGTAAACGGSTATAGTEQPGGGSSSGGGLIPTFTSLCDQTPELQGSFLTNLHATPEIDGAVMRSESAFPRSGTSQPGNGNVAPNPELVGDAWSGTNGEAKGALCTKASNPAACLAKAQGYRVLPPTREECIAKYPAGYQYQQQPVDCAASYILYTRGDEIGVARNNDEIKALIGSFDTVGEAMWVAQNAGYQRSCTGSAYGNGGIKIPDSEYRTTQDGGWDLSLVTDSCAPEVFKVVVHIDYAGNLTVLSKELLGTGGGCPIAGRRPAGFQEGTLLASGRPIGEHFASMATLEAASVTAFRRLHRQLAAFGAPPELLARIRKAARDEIRHARATGALAKKYGVTPSAPQIAAEGASPSLFAIALENAREGCVRETYGALVAHLQTTQAGDDDVRSVMLAIADEETEHAALSWDIATWIEAQLGDAERAQLAAERRAAFRTLARELATAVDPRVREASGVPAVGDALRLLDGLAPMMLAA
jgi:hypothetical protein